MAEKFLIAVLVVSLIYASVLLGERDEEINYLMWERGRKVVVSFVFQDVQGNIEYERDFHVVPGGSTVVVTAECVGQKINYASYKRGE